MHIFGSPLKPTDKERGDAINQLFDDSKASWEFYLMLLFATVIVTIGLTLDTASIIIGGMLVAPLLAPLFSLSLGVAMADTKVIVRSLKTTVVAIIIVYLISLVIGLLFSDKTINPEILSRIQPSLGYIIVAIAAGAAGTLSYLKTKLSNFLPGVAIAIAILPPLATSAIGFVHLDSEIMFGAMALFLVNIIGVVLSSVFVFSLLGFYPFRKKAEAKVEKEEKEIENGQ